MVRKRNMNKKRSQVAHYVKCELLVARRPLTIFSLSSCVRVVVVYFICFTLYDVALKYVVCIVLLYIWKYTPTKKKTIKFLCVFFICFIRFSFVQLFRSCCCRYCCIRLRSLLFLFFFLLFFLQCVYDDFFFGSGSVVYLQTTEEFILARTSSHRHKTECISMIVWVRRLFVVVVTIYSMHAIWMD